MQKNDAVSVEPGVHKVLFENERVRVLDVYLAVGGKTEMHWHPDSVSYVLNGGKMRVTRPDGTVVDVELVAGKVIPGTNSEHAVENIGNSDIHTIQVEFLGK